MAKENLGLLRTRIVRSAKKKTRVSTVKQFYDTYAADWVRLSETDVKKVVAKLKASGELSDAWTALPVPKRLCDIDEANHSRAWYKSEDSHFRGLEDVFKSVIRVAETLFPERFSRSSRTTTFICRPRQSMHSEIEGSSHMVDGIGVRVRSSYPKDAQPGSAHNGSLTFRRSGKAVFTADALVSAELKMNWTKRNREDDDRKSFSHAAHALHNDVARVAVFSFTIEGTKMRLWCHTRSHTGISKNFDINTKPEELIQFILFSTYATLTQLGIDSTVRRVVDKDGFLQYQFDIYDPKTNVTTTYQTRSVIDESSAIEIYSRAMRVFEVSDVAELAKEDAKEIDAAPVLVLRDYWVYEDVDSELVTQQAITRSLKKARLWTKAKRHFMTIKADGIVSLPTPPHVTRSAPKTRAVVPAPHHAALSYKFIDAENPDETGPSKSQVQGAAKLHLKAASAGHTSRPPPEAPKLLQLHAKKHMRTVYEQLCRDLYKVPDPVLYFYALTHVVQILRYLKRAGYLHRDVSPGNFLLYYLKGKLPSLEDMAKTRREDWIVIVSDLEYSRPYLGGAGHDPITGTSYYIAVEVQGSDYSFDSGEADTPSPALDCFAFNPYHDLESSLWMALEFVIRRAPQTVIDAKVAGRPVKEILQEHAEKMFVPRAEGAPNRYAYLTKPRQTKALRADLRRIYGEGHPVPKLLDCTLALREAYREVEDSDASSCIHLENGRAAFDPALFKDTIYDTLEATFLAISDYYARAENKEAFVRVPDPPEPVFATFSGDTSSESGKDGAPAGSKLGEEAEEGTDEEGLSEGEDSDEETQDAPDGGDAAAVGGDGDEVDNALASGSGSGAQDASGMDLDTDGAVAGRTRAASLNKRKRDTAFQPDPPTQKAKRSRTKGASPTRSSVRIRNALAARLEARQAESQAGAESRPKPKTSGPSRRKNNPSRPATR
ncbi:hypothetical protein FB107DRAFT_213996 [Schizophyllum commune]